MMITTPPPRPLSGNIAEDLAELRSSIAALTLELKYQFEDMADEFAAAVRLEDVAARVAALESSTERSESNGGT